MNESLLVWDEPEEAGKTVRGPGGALPSLSPRPAQKGLPLHHVQVPPCPVVGLSPHPADAKTKAQNWRYSAKVTQAQIFNY